ncbi:MAG: magnesium transporter CorA family protein [Candidatus Magasanikbacteria bacterium]
MAIKIIEEKNIKWINIDRVNDEALEYLKTNYKFHHLDIDDIQSGSQTPKLDVYAKYLFLVLHFPTLRMGNITIASNEVDFFVGEGYVITIQQTPSKEIKKHFYRCKNNKNLRKKWMGNDPGYLLYNITNALFHESRPLLNIIGKEISALENGIFNGHPDVKIVRQLAMLRRNVLGFRRIVDPQRYLLGNLSHTRKPFLDSEVSLYFDDINDYLSKLWAIVDTYKDSIDGLHVTVESLINQRTNKVIGTLTAISVGLMPLTLLSGIYGMNIDDLPYARDPSKVWFMFLGLAGIICLLIFIMRRKKML